MTTSFDHRSPTLVRRVAPPLQVAVAVAVCGLLLFLGAACSTIGAFVDLESDLEQEGFRNINVELDSDSGLDALQISADPPAGLGVEDAQSRAAEITWTTFPRRFDQLRVVISGTDRTYERAELEEQFGPRPAGLDDKQLEDELRNIGIGVLIALGVGALLCVGLIVLVVVLVIRSSRKKKAAQTQQWQGQTGGPGQPPWSQPPPGGPPPGPTGFPGGPPPGPTGFPGGPPPAAPPPPPQPPQQSPPGWS
ncbi:MAG: hypothetical protein WKF43_10575 [Acidimicrobiales bacterium]